MFFVSHVFGLSSFTKIWNWSHFGTFDQFSHSFLGMYEFSPFNQILLDLQNVSSALHDSILIIYVV